MRLSEELARSTSEVAPLPEDIATAGLAGNLALIARAANDGARAVRELETPSPSSGSGSSAPAQEPSCACHRSAPRRS